MIRVLVMVLALGAVAGCSYGPPPSPSEEADDAACTSAADATYKAQNYEALSRTDQAGLYYAPTPNHVFDAQQMGAMHVRDSQITACEQQGSEASSAVPSAPLVTPHIIGPQ
jgi:hypothetical protein